jgi:hypothetical protein
MSTAAAMIVLVGMRQIELRLDEHRTHPCARLLEVRLSDLAAQEGVRSALGQTGVHAARELVDYRVETGELVLRYVLHCSDEGRIEEVWERLRGVPGVVRVVIAAAEAGERGAGVSLV